MSDAGKTPEVSVVVVTYESGGTLGRCLAALKAQTIRDFEIVIADNASTDGAPQDVARAIAGVRLIENGANLGFAAGNNRAAEQARGRWLVLLNPDAYAEPGFIEAFLAAAGAYPQVRCFTALQRMAQDPERLDGLGDAMTGIGFPFRGGYGATQAPPTGPVQVFSPCGAAMMIDRSLFLELGGFDERFFCYCEDVDLGYRLRLCGEPVALIPDAVVLHEGSVSTGGRRSDFSLYHGARNRLWLYVKNTPPVLLWLTLPLHVLATIAVWVRAKAGGHASPVERGLADALAGLAGMRRSRRLMRKAGAASSLDIARALVWNPFDAIARRGWTQPLERRDRP
jgi:N-acetylglucosaminyl-diphospho-decaprenol L-rhamnosyltransferase